MEAERSQLATAVSDLAACEARILDMESQLVRGQQEARALQEQILGCASPLTCIVVVQVTVARVRIISTKRTPCAKRLDNKQQRQIHTRKRNPDETVVFLLKMKCNFRGALGSNCNCSVTTSSHLSGKI